MVLEEIRKDVLQVVAEVLECGAVQLEDGVRLDADLGADSVAKVELLSALERKFDVDLVHEENGAPMETLGEIVDFVHSRLAARP
jgi:acyl carrier protein